MTSEQTVQSPIKYMEFDLCYNEIKNGIQGELKTSNVIIIMMRCMEVVEKYKTLNGIEKRDLVLRIMIKLVEDFENDQDEKEALRLLIKTMGPSMVDSLILASKGKFQINLKKCKFKCCIE
jgi:hypothetical protein